MRVSIAPPLTHRSKTIALALFFLLVVYLCFWPFRFGANSPLLERLMDVCHIPLFGTIALVLQWSIPTTDRFGRRHILKTGILTCLMAGWVEVIQPYTGRTESFDDFRNGFFGVVIALFAVPVWLRQTRWPLRAGHGALTMLLLSVALYPAYLEWQGIQWRKQHFPLLGDFESPVELKIWTAQGEDSHSATRVSLAPNNFFHGQHALRVETSAGDWAGVSYAAGEMDWSSFSRLSLDIYNPGPPFLLFLRVDDVAAARYGREVVLKKSWTKLAVSLHDLQKGSGTGTLKTSSIHRLVLFTGQSEPSHTFYLDNVRLE